MNTHRGANSAPLVAVTAPQPISEIVRLSTRPSESGERRATAAEPREVEVDEDDLYGNMPFTD